MRINKQSIVTSCMAVALLGLTACSSIDTDPSADGLLNDDTFSQQDSQTNVVSYSCEGTSLLAMFHGEEAHILWQEKSYDLTQVISASGGHYLNSDISFWIKGHKASLTAAGLPDIECQLNHLEP